MKTKSIFVLMLGMLFVLSACDKEKESVSGRVDGHEYVDLGLPSGTLWATCNVGADSPEEYGDYFAWGETTPKSNYEWGTYKYGTGYNQLTKYCNDSDYGKNGFTDNKTVLDAEDDAATVNWGNGWRMPTLEEIKELYIHCTSDWTAQNGKTGCLLTGPNGNSIFLPAAHEYRGSSVYGAGGYGGYWLSSLVGNEPDDAYYFYFDSDYVDWYYQESRSEGLSVRPVVNR